MWIILLFLPESTLCRLIYLWQVPRSVCITDLFHSVFVHFKSKLSVIVCVSIHRNGYMRTGGLASSVALLSVRNGGDVTSLVGGRGVWFQQILSAIRQRFPLPLYYHITQKASTVWEKWRGEKFPLPSLFLHLTFFTLPSSLSRLYFLSISPSSPLSFPFIPFPSSSFPQIQLRGLGSAESSLPQPKLN